LAAVSASERSPAPSGGIYQIVESHPKRRTCTGVAIRLDRLAFKAEVAETEIEIRDDKHDADLRSIVGWQVSGDGGQLTIRLKENSPDFGPGNAIRVCVERSAFRPGRQPGNERECWSIGTDPL
jgi:hypothetical protein